ncbi:MAG TPA: hypothetical protein DDY52_05105 [Candidatus Moranbacteria bacterium]|nr:hypothetical protein [Candidatus Moranbacteria bacterium]
MGSALLFIIAISSFVFFKKSDLSDNKQVTVKEISSNAFGELGSIPADVNQPISTQGSLSYNAREAVKVEGRGGAYMDMGFPNQFIIAYKGQPLTLNENQATVLRRIKEMKIDSFNNLISSHSNLVNLSSFAKAELQSFTLSQDKPFGYNISVNTQEGTVSIDQNWYKWNPNCTNYGCGEEKPLEKKDMPSDEEIIALADGFIKEHGINMDNFTKGEVNKEWQRFAPELSSAMPYIPTDITVTYPRKIQNKTVYNLYGGNKDGVMVNVNIRHKRVSGLYGLTTQKYESSLYEAETDFGHLVKIAERGNNQNNYYPTPMGDVKVFDAPQSEKENESKKKTIELDTPSFELVRYDHYKDYKTKELLIPALVFPVIDAQKNNYPQKNIVVPIIKGLFK